MSNLILSTCGTSILTNTADNELRSILIKYSNLGQDEYTQISETDWVQIEQHIEERKKLLLDSSINEISKKSAELAGIIAYYKGKPDKSDIHYLLSTDTWLGKKTVELVSQWIENHLEIKPIIHCQDGLQTADWRRFNYSLSELVKWCDNTIQPYKDAYHVVFNLSGGFKSETGFLQVLGMFYADETIYMFEKSGELMQVPHLPLRMDDENTILNDLKNFRRAFLELPLENKDMTGIYFDNGRFTPWGELVFRKMKNAIYKKEVYAPPSTKIKFGNTFLASCKNIEADRKKLLNERIDCLSQMQEMGSKPNLNSLDFKKLSAKKVGVSDYEFDAWADKDAKRVFCHKENNDIIVLDRLDKALH